MNRREELNAIVKDSITEALITMLDKESFEDISITDLAKRAGVGRVSFYRNFENKEDVIRQYLAKLFHVWSESLHDIQGFELIEAIFSFFYENKEIFLLLYRRGLSHLSLQCVRDAYGPKPQQDNAAAYGAAFISYGLYGWLEEWFKRGIKESPAEMAALLEKIIPKN